VIVYYCGERGIRERELVYLPNPDRGIGNRFAASAGGELEIQYKLSMQYIQIVMF
jgi:hypothetical protein